MNQPIISYVFTREQVVEALVRGLDSMLLIPHELFQSAINKIGSDRLDEIAVLLHANGWSVEFQSPGPGTKKSETLDKTPEEAKQNALPKKKTGPKPVSPEEVKALLSQKLGGTIPIATVRKWTPRQLREAKKWAISGAPGSEPEHVVAVMPGPPEKSESEKPKATRKRHSSPPAPIPGEAVLNGQGHHDPVGSPIPPG